MPKPSKKRLRQEEWSFDDLLKAAKLEHVRFCHRYEFGREALDYDWLEAHSTRNLGECAMLFQHPDVLGENMVFYMHYFRMFESGIWLKVPYFNLPEEFRGILAEQEKIRLSSVIDPRSNLDRGPVDRVELVIPLNASHTYLCACFAAFLEVEFPKSGPTQSLKKEVFPKEGAEAEIRQLKTELRSLGAFRLLEHLSIKEATDLTKSTLGHPLYSSPPSWSVAKKRADRIIKSLRADLNSLIKVLSRAPKGVTGVSNISGSIELEYS